MEVGQGPNVACSAKGKKNVLLFNRTEFDSEGPKVTSDRHKAS
jgi:hypothetical protein